MIMAIPLIMAISMIIAHSGIIENSLIKIIIKFLVFIQNILKTWDSFFHGLLNKAYKILNFLLIF